MTPPQPAEMWLVEASFQEAVKLWANECYEPLWRAGFRLLSNPFGHLFSLDRRSTCLASMA
jgi:hypothetical protein